MEQFEQGRRLRSLDDALASGTLYIPALEDEPAYYELKGTDGLRRVIIVLTKMRDTEMRETD